MLKTLSAFIAAAFAVSLLASSPVLAKTIIIKRGHPHPMMMHHHHGKTVIIKR